MTGEGITTNQREAATPRDPFACRCRAFPPGPSECTTRATQEDMLCDDCRAGCGMAVGIDEGNSRHLAIKTESFTFRTGPR